MKRLLCLLFWITAATLTAQPVNDNPCGAIQLSLLNGATCVPDQALNWQNATATPGFAQPFPLKRETRHPTSAAANGRFRHKNALCATLA